MVKIEARATHVTRVTGLKRRQTGVRGKTQPERGRDAPASGRVFVCREGGILVGAA